MPALPMSADCLGLFQAKFQWSHFHRGSAPEVQFSYRVWFLKVFSHAMKSITISLQDEFGDIFLVADTKLSSGHPANGVRGNSRLESMDSMNWVTYIFMRARHISFHGMLWGGEAFVAIARVI